MTLPKDFHAMVGAEVSSHLDEQLTAVAEAGGDKFFIDLNKIETPTLPIIELVLSAISAANKLSIRHVIVASNEIKSKCRGYEETESWMFAGTFEEAAEKLAAAAAGVVP